MKRKSIYKTFGGRCCSALHGGLPSVAGAGTTITAYIVFRVTCFLLRVCLSAVYALGVALLFLSLLFLLIL